MFPALTTNNPDNMGNMTVIDILKKCREGAGRIVSSGDLCELAISEAQAKGFFFVDDEGFGFAFLPWELTTDKDRERETSFSEANGNELIALRTMQDKIATIMGAETSISVALAYIEEWKKSHDAKSTKE